MLILNRLAGFGMPTPLGVEASFLTSAVNTNGLTTYTFSSVSFGAAEATRRIVVIVHSGTTAGLATVSSATIGGVAATIHVQASAPAQFLCSIISAVVPEGTSGDIVVTLTGASNNMGIGVFRLVKQIQAAPIATATDITVASATLQSSIEIKGRGVLIFGCSQNPNAGITFVGANEAYDQLLEGTIRQGGAFVAPLSDEAARTISSNITSSTFGALAAVSFR